MADTMTVTFGGREVVLEPLQPYSDAFWTSDSLELCRLGWQWYASLRGFIRIVQEERGDSPQSAVTALETKLRSLRDELDRVLGEAK